MADTLTWKPFWHCKQGFIPPFLSFFLSIFWKMIIRTGVELLDDFCFCYSITQRNVVSFAINDIKILKWGHTLIAKIVLHLGFFLHRIMGEIFHIVWFIMQMCFWREGIETELFPHRNTNLLRLEVDGSNLCAILGGIGGKNCNYEKILSSLTFTVISSVERHGTGSTCVNYN